MKHISYLLCLLCILVVSASYAATKPTTLDDLKKLEITCLVPGRVPEGYRLKKIEIDYEDREGAKNEKDRRFPGYSMEYTDGKKGSFTIECARWGIGDRNLDQNDRAEETQFDHKTYGPVYIIYFPPGKTGGKKRITANWIADTAMREETAKNPKDIAIKGRFHGVSGSGMTLANYEKIVRSLHPVREK